MTYELRCPVCRRTEASPMLSRGVTLGVVRCSSCSMVRLAEPESPKDLYGYYAERIGRSRDEIYIPLTSERLGAVLDELERVVPGRRLLDVGCGEGQLVDAAVHHGWDALGIDVTPAAIKISESFGLPCAVIDVFSDELIPGTYDLVTMVEVLEHVPEPDRFLARAEQLLRPGGVLYVTTPNFASLGRRVLGPSWPALSPEHLWYFTPPTLQRLAATVTTLAVGSVSSRNISAAALRRLIPIPRRRPRPQDVGSHVSESFVEEQALRHRVESSRGLRLAKRAANIVLDRFGLGETLVATFMRQRSAA